MVRFNQSDWDTAFITASREPATQEPELGDWETLYLVNISESEFDDTVRLP